MSIHHTDQLDWAPKKNEDIQSLQNLTEPDFSISDQRRSQTYKYIFYMEMYQRWPSVSLGVLF